MKHKFLLVVLFLGMVQLSFAQRSTSSSNFKGGLRAGFTATQISGDDLTGFHKLGAYAGAFVNFPLSDNLKWKFQSELDFVMKGSHTYYPSGQNATISSKYVLNIGYIEVPVLIKWNLVPNMELEFGPTFGVLLYQRERNSNGIMLYRPDFRRYELGVMGGLSYLFHEHYGVSLRYSNSVIPVRIPTWAVSRRVKKQFNSALAVSFFYQF